MSDNNQHFDDELLSAYVDGELSGEQLAQVEQRLETNADARQLVEELRDLSQAVKSLPAETIGEDLRSTIMQRAEREMLLGSEKTVAPTQHQPHTARRWTWAAMAIAATLLLTAYLPTTKQVEKPLANAERLRSPVADNETREIPRMEAVEEAETAVAGVSSAPSVASDEASRTTEGEEAEAAGVRRGGLGGESLAAKADNDRADAFVGRELTDAESAIDFYDVRCVVDIKLNDNTKAVEQFDKMLYSNGIAFQPEAPDSEGANTEKASTEKESTSVSSGRFAAKASELKDKNESVSEPVAEAATTQFIVVEAPVEQIEGVLEESNFDVGNYAEVLITEQQASAEPSLERLQQWQRAANQPAQSKLRNFKRKVNSALQSQQGRAQRIDENQYRQNQLMQQGKPLQKKAYARAKKLASQDPVQVLFILRGTSTTEPMAPAEVAPADR